jgi:predicted histone-like DNA-binding protein
MYYKETQDPMPDKNGHKLWRPEVMRTGEVIGIDELSKLISEATTVTEADIVAVLYSLPQVMNLNLKEGHTVRLDKIGTFSIYGRSQGKGVVNKEDVRPSQFGSLSIRFTPEYTVTTNGQRIYPLLEGIKFTHINHLLRRSGSGDNAPSEPGTQPNEPDTQPAEPPSGGGGFTDPDARTIDNE